MKENNIEEEIKRAIDKFSDNKDKNSAILIVENFILGNYILIGGRTNIVKDSLRYILSDYKRVLQENEYMHNELDKQQTKINKYAKENEELKKFHIQDNKHLDFIMENSITVQKVKDKIEKEIKYHEKNILDIENITMLKGKTAKEEAEIEFNKYAIVVLKKMLQELIEGRK